MFRVQGYLIIKFILSGWMSLVFLMSIATAQEHRNLATIVSQSEFEQLVLHTARKIPEIRMMWSIDPSARWHGGTFHRLLQWHYQQLQRHTPDEVHRFSPPTWDELQPTGGKDIDICTQPEFHSEIEAAFGHRFEFDFITPESFVELIKIGGSTLEKVGLTRNGFYDPLNGVQSYLSGVLHFEIPHWEDFEKLPIVIYEDYAMTTVALRVLRTLRNFPEVQLSEVGLGRIRAISLEEPLEFVQKDYRFEYLQIVSNKLYTTLGNNPIQFFRVLRHYNLLLFLNEAGLEIPYELQLVKLAEIIPTTRPSGLEDFSMQEMSSVAEILKRSTCSAAVLKGISSSVGCFFRRAYRGLRNSIQPGPRQAGHATGDNIIKTLGGQTVTCRDLFGTRSNITGP